ncbi:hypothetical protein BN10_1390019 [Phycicoccus elongatus Lp2]|uniref:Uncharacterized protein n=1 Tax=Phycicoccus elongatus Lp2 TaxID=1193181 RepID=N0DYA1_9MICO|nr:hypothetical protein BN10_1390019 [Phycicoccus elongatus Lp2]
MAPTARPPSEVTIVRLPSDPDPVLVPTQDMDDSACAVCSNRVGWRLAWSTTGADGLDFA